jgi:hypothetical protein
MQKYTVTRHHVLPGEKKCTTEYREVASILRGRPVGPLGGPARRLGEDPLMHPADVDVLQARGWRLLWKPLAPIGPCPSLAEVCRLCLSAPHLAPVWRRICQEITGWPDWVPDSTGITRGPARHQEARA